jgi:hypothetical protein
VPAALLLAGILCGGLGACGGGRSQSAKSLVRDAFAPHRPLDSGVLGLTFALAGAPGSGSHAPREALLLHLAGPFQRPAASGLPRFAMTIELRSGALRSHALRAAATSTAGKLYIGLGGRQFLAPPAAVSALARGYATASGRSVSTTGSSIAALGAEPAAWLAEPRIAGRRRLAGVDTVHIVAALNVARFLADARAVSALVTPQGLAVGKQLARLLGPALAAAPSPPVRPARVDLFTGAQDHLPRRLSLSVTVATAPPSAPARVRGRLLTLTLVLAMSAVNQPQTIVAPSHPRPVSELVALLPRLGLTAGVPAG